MDRNLKYISSGMWEFKNGLLNKKLFPVKGAALKSTNVNSKWWSHNSSYISHKAKHVE